MASPLHLTIGRCTWWIAIPIQAAIARYGPLISQSTARFQTSARSTTLLQAGAETECDSTWTETFGLPPGSIGLGAKERRPKIQLVFMLFRQRANCWGASRFRRI